MYFAGAYAAEIDLGLLTVEDGVAVVTISNPRRVLTKLSAMSSRLSRKKDSVSFVICPVAIPVATRRVCCAMALTCRSEKPRKVATSVFNTPLAAAFKSGKPHLVEIEIDCTEPGAMSLALDGRIEARFAEARGRRNEGLMVKDPASVYSPGRRGLGWLKLKKALATLDCVVVGVEVGHGKRHGVLSDYTFAVRDEARGALVTIGKAYTGLTDAELAEWTRWFEAHTLERHGRYRVVEPTVVVEVAFDVLMRSSRHRSGFALRFPRIVRIRDDKPAAEIDTLATVEALFVSAQAGAEHLVTMGAAA